MDLWALEGWVLFESSLDLGDLSFIMLMTWALSLSLDEEEKWPLALTNMGWVNDEDGALLE